MNYLWPEDDKQVVNCPNCSSPCELDLELVKELSLPLRPAYCICCDAEFELYHDGTTQLKYAHCKVSDSEADAIIRKVNRMVFDPR